MRTNDLFRDLLEGRIVVRTQDERIREAATKLVQAAGIAFTDAADMLTRFTETIALTAPQIKMLGKALGIPEQPPHDPRERALWAKRNRGTGPNATPLRVRGRTTHYREKG